VVTRAALALAAVALGCEGSVPSPATLAVAAALPIAVAADDRDVTWLEYAGDGRLLRAPRAGGAAEVLATGLVRPVALALDPDGSVVWAEAGLARTGAAGGRVRRLAPGGTPTDLAVGQDRPGAIAVRAGLVYWRNQGDGRIRAVPVAGGAVIELAAGQPGPGGLVLAADGVVWLAVGGTYYGGEVMRVPFDGGEPVSLGARYQGNASVAVDAAGSVYIANHVTGGILRLAAGDPVRLADFQEAPRSLVAAGPWLYWAAYGFGPRDGTVMRVSAAGGGAPETVAAELAGPLAIAVAPQGDAVYWVTRGGQVMSAAVKP